MYVIDGTEQVLDGFGLSLDRVVEVVQDFRQFHGVSDSLPLTEYQLDDVTVKVCQDGGIWPLKEATDAMKLRGAVDFVDHWRREAA